MKNIRTLIIWSMFGTAFGSNFGAYLSTLIPLQNGFSYITNGLALGGMLGILIASMIILSNSGVHKGKQTRVSPIFTRPNSVL